MARSGFGGTSSLLMAVAVAAMAGFMFWIYTRAESLDSDVTPVMEDTADAADTRVTLASLRDAPESAVGKSAWFDTVEVNGTLGRGVFTLAVDDTAVYPVLLERDMIERGMTLYGGDQINVGGRFYVLNDSIREAWIDGGAVSVDSASQLPQSPSFMLADSVAILQ